MTRTLEDRYRRLEQAATECGSSIAAAGLLGEDNSGYRVQLSFEEFISALLHCRPRMLYVLADKFEPYTNLAAYLEKGDEGEEEELFGHPKAKAVIARVAQREGELGSLLATFVCEGVAHSTFEQTKWLDEFENDADELDALLAHEAQQREEQFAKRAQATTDKHIRALCAHPKFNDGRPSREKREFLARHLFPDLDRREIHDLVEAATNADWLNS